MSADEKSALDNKTRERAFILECIELYKTLPALWNVKSEEYTNRQRKNASYDILVNKYREKFPDATREDVTKKFNSLRTNYRKELKRINDTKQSSDAATTMVEKSALWYFNEMNFLADQGVIRKLINTIEEKKEENNSTNNITQVNNGNVITIKEETVEEIKQPRKKKCVQDELMNLAYNRLKTSESEYDKIAKTWAIELQKLSPEQQIHAKKAINDVLYEGQLGNLYRNCVKISDPPNNHFFAQSSNSRSTINSVETDLENSQHSQYSKESYIVGRCMSI